MTGFGENELDAVRNLDARLRGEHAEGLRRLDELRATLRLAFVAGAEEWAQRELARPLESSELTRASSDNFPKSGTRRSAWALVDLTHAERPWRETPQNEEISLERMASFFSERLAAPTRAAGA